jgi:hypothetical protein
MLANGNAQFIEFDSVEAAERRFGDYGKADPAAYATARITGNYEARYLAGLDPLNNRAAMSGRFSSDGRALTTRWRPQRYGRFLSDVLHDRELHRLRYRQGSGHNESLHVCHRSIGQFEFAFYIVNSGKLFVMERDTVKCNPMLSGSVLQQQRPAGGFTNASLNGRMIYPTGLSSCGGPKATVPKAVIGLFTSTAMVASLTYDENYCNAANSVTASGTYSVESDGRHPSCSGLQRAQ